MSGRPENFVRETFIALIREHGASLVNDPRRCEALLKDLCGQYPSQVRVLVEACCEGIPIRILVAKKTGEAQDAVIDRLANHLDDLGNKSSLARWAVEACAAAINCERSPGVSFAAVGVASESSMVEIFKWQIIGLSFLFKTGATCFIGGVIDEIRDIFPDVFKFINSVLAKLCIDRAEYYWNPQESGHGLFLYRNCDGIALIWNTYDLDGSPLWFVAPRLVLQSSGDFVGNLYRYSELSSSGEDKRLGASAVKIGKAEIEFFLSGDLSFSYSIDSLTQKRKMQRFEIVPPAKFLNFVYDRLRFNHENHSGIWCIPGEVGCKINLLHQDNAIFIVWCKLNERGRPLWISGLAALQKDGAFRGTLHRTQNGVPWLHVSGHYPTPQPIPQVGDVLIKFYSAVSGELIWTIDGIQGESKIRTVSLG